MIFLTDAISLEENELEYQFIKASGPGGQNVNKVASAVQLRFDVKRSPSLPEDVRSRLIRLAGRRISRRGVLVIDARRFRHQEQNRQDALRRLKHLILKAIKKPKVRIKTKPTALSKEKRLASKRMQSEKKRLRRPIGPMD
jgi:ribosome-associated protein